MKSQCYIRKPTKSSMQSPHNGDRCISIVIGINFIFIIWVLHKSLKNRAYEWCFYNSFTWKLSFKYVVVKCMTADENAHGDYVLICCIEVWECKFSMRLLVQFFFNLSDLLIPRESSPHT